MDPIERTRIESIKTAMISAYFDLPYALDILNYYRERDFPYFRRVCRNQYVNVLTEHPEIFLREGRVAKGVNKKNGTEYCFLSIADNGAYYKFAQLIFSLSEIEPRDTGRLLVDPFETSAGTHSSIECPGLRQYPVGTVIKFDIDRLNVNPHELNGKCPSNWRRYVCPLVYFGLDISYVESARLVTRGNAHISLALLGTPWSPR